MSIKRHLGRELDILARRSALSVSGAVVREGQDEIQEIANDPHPRFARGTVYIPSGAATGDYYELGLKPIVADTLQITYSNITYEPGVDFVEDSANGRFQNLGISTGRTVQTAFYYYEGAASGAGVTDHGALTGLLDDDHSIYALANGTRLVVPHIGAVPTTGRGTGQLGVDGDTLKRWNGTAWVSVVQPPTAHAHDLATATTDGFMSRDTMAEINRMLVRLDSLESKDDKTTPGTATPATRRASFGSTLKFGG